MLRTGGGASERDLEGEESAVVPSESSARSQPASQPLTYYRTHFTFGFGWGEPLDPLARNVISFLKGQTGVLDQLLMELHRFLLILDKETLSGNATIQKGLLSDLLQSYRTSIGADEEYIYMNKVIVGGKDKGDKDDRSDALVNGKAAKFVPIPQKSLPDLPPPRTTYHQV
ncbi:hypothetical protein L3Q82_001011 [Scortum barcoo]|uniref:Uncharacterized protein n=1 Tax=Scortum barcoo TaxID=214431 RepID=A0ACB8WDJ9_9TELE|nr:hypothetical protein L3Q82_001011 [Scortum barcoo]